MQVKKHLQELQNYQQKFCEIIAAFKPKRN